MKRQITKKNSPKVNNSGDWRLSDDKISDINRYFGRNFKLSAGYVDWRMISFQPVHDAAAFIYCEPSNALITLAETGDESSRIRITQSLNAAELLCYEMIEGLMRIRKVLGIANDCEDSNVGKEQTDHTEVDL
jgi:hypothetical protein